MNTVSDIAELAATVSLSLDNQGWAWVPNFQPHDDGGNRLLELAATLGKVCAMGRNGSSLIETGCDHNAPDWEPFNRPEAIGWHNDFSTWLERPTLSFAWMRSVPTNHESQGDWRVVCCADIITSLSSSSIGRRSLLFLQQNVLPFIFAPGEAVSRFRVLDAAENTKARYYGRALRLGLTEEPNQLATEAIAAWESAADMLGRRLPAIPGALLICDNWRSMHDRLKQAPGRRSSLAFVANGIDQEMREDR